MAIWITGCAGFLGTRLAAALTKKGFDVVGLSRRPSTTATQAVSIDLASPEARPCLTELLARAGKAGQRIGASCKQMHEQQGPPAVRRIQGVLSFLKKYGVARVEEACAMALEMEVYNYQFVRRYLERNAQPPVSLRQVDPLIRQLTLYRDLIQERTKETTE